MLRGNPKGYKHSEETKQRISLALKGKQNAKGTKRSEETKHKYRVSKTAEKNPMWVGSRIRYHGLHAWVKRRLSKPTLCQGCKTNAAYDLTNISGKYLRDLNDWQYLCRRCHMINDGRIYNLKQYDKPDNNAKVGPH